MQQHVQHNVAVLRRHAAGLGGRRGVRAEEEQGGGTMRGVGVQFSDSWVTGSLGGGSHGLAAWVQGGCSSVVDRPAVEVVEAVW